MSQNLQNFNINPVPTPAIFVRCSRVFVERSRSVFCLRPNGRIHDIEGISISKNINKSDVMDWMTTYQDVRRNMCEAERIYANDKVSARRIEEENEKKRLAGGKPLI